MVTLAGYLNDKYVIHNSRLTPASKLTNKLAHCFRTFLVSMPTPQTRSAEKSRLATLHQGVKSRTHQIERQVAY